MKNPKNVLTLSRAHQNTIFPELFPVPALDSLNDDFRFFEKHETTVPRAHQNTDIFLCFPKTVIF